MSPIFGGGRKAPCKRPREEIIRIKNAVEPEIKKESEKRMLSGKPSARR
jgi:hypothetical protein